MEDHASGTVAIEPSTNPPRVPWNKGKLVGAKPPLRPSHIWSIRTKLEIEGKKRDLALFNLAIDSKWLLFASTTSPQGATRWIGRLSGRRKPEDP